VIDSFELFPEKKLNKIININNPKKLKKLKKRDFAPKESHFNTGRWQKEEHQRFVEAILKFGNEWKKVQKYVKTRSSTQARSHAQKFFFKIKRSNVLDIDIDLNKNSIKTLYEFANKLDEEKYESTIKTLNVIAFEKNSNLGKERMSLDYTITTNEENFSRNESTSLFGRSESYNNEEIIFSADDINMDTTSQLTSNSSSFKKTHKKDHQKLFIEDEKEAKQAPENEKVESKLNEIKQKRRRRKSSSFIRIYPDCEITVFDLYNSCDDEEIHNDEPLVSFQNCFNFFFNQKVNCDVFDEEEFEKYYLLKEAKR